MGGRVIGNRYRLAEKIGHGGMGQVWAGYDERLDRRVAVKLLRTEALLGGEGTRERTALREDLRRRFLRECRITAGLDHPGLVTVFDAGQDEDELYLVMQRLPGIGLGDLLAEEGPLPIPWAVAVAAQICAALSVVHAVPVVHRDLKPSNVMVRPDGRVVVLDLGIATALDGEHTRLTMTGVPIGSPSYMAPEQALSGAVDARSDLYALGCLLHEMLAGEEPFRAPTALGVLRRQVDDAPVPLRQLRPEVPAELEALVLDLLAKPPAARPADAQTVHQRLRPLLPGAAPGARPPYGPVPDPTGPFRHPHQPLPGPATAPVAAPPPLPLPAPPSAPSVPADLAAACGEVSDLLAAHRYAEVIDLAARLLPRARAAHGDGAPLVRTLRTIYARTLLQEGQYRAALPEYQLLAAAASAEAGPRAEQALEHRRKAAACLEQLGRGAQALAEYQGLLADHTARLASGQDTDPSRCFDLRERIGLLLAGSGDTEGAWDWLLALLFDREPRLGPHHPDVQRLRRHLDQLQHHRRTGSQPPLPQLSPTWPPPPGPAVPQPLDPRTGSWPSHPPHVSGPNPYRA
ncbi:serine/threonine-protein kinase [Kitasatospora sp. NBC_01287]|uniref:serine/threonine-protein kinase n=1 Tax=Kitasatospora sp. NBC_01287 TaxID=2903573 RepID=UPI00225BDE0A|nr:serine/threonine-protein kinase [Kitasatospora sp. NBC_01287]MCX4747099.1 serine/threonine-protein kinase [Kitasatospora sp. NBC_01287]